MGACQHTSLDDVGLSALLSASVLSGQTHIKTCMGVRVRVYPELCHSAGMPSHDKREETVLNELELHGIGARHTQITQTHTIRLLHTNTTWAAVPHCRQFSVLIEKLLQQKQRRLSIPAACMSCVYS